MLRKCEFVFLNIAITVDISSTEYNFIKILDLYAGSERIASKLGGGFELASVNPTDDNHDLAPITSYTSMPEFYDQKKADLMELLGHSWDCVNMQGYATLEGEQLLSIEELQNSNNPENEMFFYHTDHLGSSSWITDASGEAYQHLQNMPYGEQFINQRQSSWGSVFQFTGKERDSETGYSYFGARYYDSDLSVWLSVDPLADKNQGISPYNYCSYNPILITDPDGRDGRITFTENEDGTGGTISIESTIHVYGKGAKEAAANANAKFAELKGNPTTVELDGKKYEVQMNITYVYSEELDKLGMNVFDLDYSDLEAVSDFKLGDNVLQVGVPEGGGNVGVIGEAQRGGTFGYSMSKSGVDVVHESLHLIGLGDTYSGCCTPKPGFENDIMTIGKSRGKNINQHHFNEMSYMAKYFLDTGKKALSEGYRPTGFSQDKTNRNQYNISYRNENPEYIRRRR